ncbi:MAG: class I SAM-dependent methyltransferase [Planctomycetota bacterium]
MSRQSLLCPSPDAAILRPLPRIRPSWSGSPLGVAWRETVGELRERFLDLDRRIAPIEAALRAAAPGPRAAAERAVGRGMAASFAAEVHAAMAFLDERLGAVAAAEHPEERMQLQRRLHPIVLRSPFSFRTFAKPLGYAGDYAMVNMMFRESLEGRGVGAQLLNHAFLQTAPVVAHRNRVAALAMHLRAAVDASADKGAGAAGPPLRVLSLGCGPAQEVQHALARGWLRGPIEITLVDFNRETLDAARGRLVELGAHGRPGVEIRYVERSVQELLRQLHAGGGDFAPGSYDLAYCAGLFDYLSPKICRRLCRAMVTLLAPAGLAIATNVSDANPDRAWMEWVLEWNLAHRSRAEMEALIPVSRALGDARLHADVTGVNWLLEMRKAAPRMAS